MQQVQQQMQMQQPQHAVQFSARTGEGVLTITSSTITMSRSMGRPSQFMQRDQLAGARLKVQFPEWLVGGSAKLTFIAQSGQRVRVRSIKVRDARNALAILGIVAA